MFQNMIEEGRGYNLRMFQKGSSAVRAIDVLSNVPEEINEGQGHRQQMLHKGPRG
jgi:hypothetical protein